MHDRLIEQSRTTDAAHPENKMVQKNKKIIITLPPHSAAWWH